MRTSIRTLAFAAAFLAAPLAARGAVLRILSADERGVTVQVTTENWSLAAPDAATGRARIVGVPAARSLAMPGRALLPSYSALLAVPPDARPSLKVVARGAAVTREGVKLVVAGRPAFKPDPDGGPDVPYTEAADPIVTGGAWPGDEARLGTPASFRGRRLVGVEVMPFQYDEAASRLVAVTSLTVRIDWNRPFGARAQASGGGTPDPAFDAAYEKSVLNFEQARAWRSAPAGLAAQPLFARPSAALPAALTAFDESEPEVRVLVDSTGIYQLPYDLLAPKGYPAGVPIAEVGVHRHEFLEGQNPPYGTIDVPVEVEDVNANGTFDSGDLIVMYAANWAKRSGASRYQRWWGDADQVFVTRVAGGGARIPTRAGWRGATGLTPPASYPYTRHYELNGAFMQTFIRTPADTNTDLFHWVQNPRYYSRPDTILFETNDADTSGAATITVNWVGRSIATHYEWAAVRRGDGLVTSVADSVSWFSLVEQTATATLFGSALSAGRTNAMRLWGKGHSGAPDGTANEIDLVGFNWFDVTYSRAFLALNGVLTFSGPNTGGEYQVHAGRFLADSTRLYDVTDPEHPVRLVLDEAHVVRAAQLAFDFQDSAAAGQRRSYVAAAISYGEPTYGPRTPPASSFTTVTRRQLYAATGRPDYLMVVPEAFLSAVQPLVDLRRSQGLEVLVAPAEAVYDEFNGGRHSAIAIQRFTRWAYQQWDSRFLLLVGDGTLDPMHYGPLSGTDWVPTMPLPGPVGVSQGFEMVTGDPLYGCLTGNCGRTGGGPILTELMIGRLPVNSLANAQAVIAKVVAYETHAGDESWRRHLLLLSDDAFSGDSFGGDAYSGYCYHPDEEHFVGLNRKCASIVTRDAGLSLTNAELFNLGDYLANEPTTTGPLGTCRPSRSDTQGRTRAAVTPVLLSRLNGGVLWWNYQGHANEHVLTHEDLWKDLGDNPDTDDSFQLTNTGKLFLFSAFSCHANNFGKAQGGPNLGTGGGCVGEDLVALGSTGAIGSWASSCFEVIPRDDSTHINVELARSLFSDPPVDEFVPGDRGARVVTGEAVQSAMLRYVPTYGQYYGESGIAMTYTLLGDPATRISVGYPQPIVTANDVPVDPALPVRVHTAGDTVRFVADLVSTERLDTLGVYQDTGAGDVPVDAAAYAVTPAFPDTAGGGVFGGRRFRVVYVAQPPARSVTYTFRTRDRDGLQSDFRASLPLESTLRVDGTPIQNGDVVSPLANLSIYVVCPRPLAPAADLALTVNGQPVAFNWTAAPGDTSGREWLLSWPHAEYPIGEYAAVVTVAGGATLLHNFKVQLGASELRVSNLFAFPNPFDNDGTSFTFDLLGPEAADVKVDVYTISGRKLDSWVTQGLSPGYHQIAWDGRDAEGTPLANGVYFYRLSARSPGGLHDEHLGRLVKLRKPRRVEADITP